MKRARIKNECWVIADGGYQYIISKDCYGNGYLWVMGRMLEFSKQNIVYEGSRRECERYTLNH